MGTGYRPPSREPKGRWARHIHARRREEGWSQTRGFEAVQKAGLGLGEKSRSAYIAIDMGDRQPTAAEEKALLAVYGPPPEVEPEPVTEPPDNAILVAAIDRQTAALLAAISARDEVIENLLTELAHYRQQTVQARTVEQSLIEALPQALATALVTAIAATREDDPVAELPVAAPPVATQR